MGDSICFACVCVCVWMMHACLCFSPIITGLVYYCTVKSLRCPHIDFDMHFLSLIVWIFYCEMFTNFDSEFNINFFDKELCFLSCETRWGRVMFANVRVCVFVFIYVCVFVYTLAMPCSAIALRCTQLKQHSCVSMCACECMHVCDSTNDCRRWICRVYRITVVVVITFDVVDLMHRLRSWTYRHIRIESINHSSSSVLYFLLVINL